MEIIAETLTYAAELLIYVVPLLLGALFLVEMGRSYFGEERLSVLLAGRSAWEARLRAALLGALLPFCECGAFPVGIALIKAGVPLAAVLTFFLISPVISIPAFILLSGLFSIYLAVAYLLVTLLLGLTAALLIEKTGLADASLKLKAGAFAGEQANESRLTIGTAACCTDGCSSSPEENNSGGAFNTLKIVARSALVQVLHTFRKIIPYMLAAVVAAGLLVSTVPEETIKGFLDMGGLWGVPVAALLGIPVYQGDCAMISVVAPLIKATGAMGPGIAFIIAGTGTSINGIILLSALFKRKFIAAYVVSVLIISVVTGYLLQLLY